ncbi:hypothetical protein [Spirosoma koreense]
MQMIRQYAVPHDQIVQVTVPEEFNNKTVEIQVILVDAAAANAALAENQTILIAPPTQEKQHKKNGGLGYLVGSLSHLSSEEKEKMNRELQELRDSWERDI